MLKCCFSMCRLTQTKVTAKLPPILFLTYSYFYIAIANTFAILNGAILSNSFNRNKSLTFSLTIFVRPIQRNTNHRIQNIFSACSILNNIYSIGATNSIVAIILSYY